MKFKRAKEIIVEFMLYQNNDAKHKTYNYEVGNRNIVVEFYKYYHIVQVCIKLKISLENINYLTTNLLKFFRRKNESIGKCCREI